MLRTTKVNQALNKARKTTTNKKNSNTTQGKTQGVPFVFGKAAASKKQELAALEKDSLAYYKLLQ
jgi:hypothetical protein